jgi:hypothetical protein
MLQCREIGFEIHEEVLKVLHELHTAMKTHHAYQSEFRQAESKLQVRVFTKCHRDFREILLNSLFSRNFVKYHLQYFAKCCQNPVKFRIANQGCGSGFRDFVDPDPYWESGSRGQKTKKF